MLIQDLQAVLKKALSGEVETLLLELLMPPLEFEAHRLQQAMVVRAASFLFLVRWRCSEWVFFNLCMHTFLWYTAFLQGLGTDEETLMEILSTRTGKQLQDISAAYHYCKTHCSPTQKTKQNNNVQFGCCGAPKCCLIFVLLFVFLFSV